jgi:hypothetical protein
MNLEIGFLTRYFRVALLQMLNAHCAIRTETWLFGWRHLRYPEGVRELSPRVPLRSTLGACRV